MTRVSNTIYLCRQWPELLDAINKVPEHCRQGLIDYFAAGVTPGDFLCAVILNDLHAAAHQADAVNISKLHAYAGVLHWAPGGSWGSDDNLISWSGLRGGS